ncbi:MAG: MoaD/ThiS family protein [Desulfobacterales bacterium]|nr:MoaD/ThiS family protein [Desulfobacterales bacterium]
MKIDLKCFANLVDPGTCDFRESTGYTLKDGTTVKDLIREAGIDHKKVKVAFVNSNVVNLDTALSEGDRVGLVPAVGGM